MSTKERVMPKFTKAPAVMVALFERATGPLPGVTPKKMFGYSAAFLNGNMFACLFQDRMMLRLSEADRGACRRQFGAKPFEPSPGRVMREYVEVPDALLKSEKLLNAWLEKSHAYASSLPPKTPKSKSKAHAKKA